MTRTRAPETHRTTSVRLLPAWADESSNPFRDSGATNSMLDCDDIEKATHRAQIEFLAEKMRVIQRGENSMRFEAEQAKLIADSGGIFTLGSWNFVRFARSRLLKMRGAKGAHAPKLKFSRLQVETCTATWFGVFLTLLALSATSQYVQELSDGKYFIIIGSWGALMTLLFSAPASPLVQPRNIFGGNLLSATVAILFNYLSGADHLGILPKWIAVALAPATAIAGMQFFGVSHPPAGAVSLIFIGGSSKITSTGWAFLLLPLFLGNVIAILLASWINNLSAKRQYPLYW